MKIFYKQFFGSGYTYYIIKYLIFGNILLIFLVILHENIL